MGEGAIAVFPLPGEAFGRTAGDIPCRRKAGPGGVLCGADPSGATGIGWSQRFETSTAFRGSQVRGYCCPANIVVPWNPPGTIHDHPSPPRSRVSICRDEKTSRGSGPIAQMTSGHSVPWRGNKADTGALGGRVRQR